MRRIALMLLTVATITGCDGWYRITVEMPYCPASDSAKKAADSIPIACLFPDTSGDPK